MIEKVQELGLTRYEAKAYVSLVKNGTMTALDISTKSAVPHGKIYPVLKQLERKKFVQKYPGKPQRFVAIDPTVVVRQAQQAKQKEAQRFNRRTTRLLDKLGALGGQNDATAVDKIRIVEGYKSYLNLSVALHKKAKKEWLTISELSLYKPHIDAYRKNVKKGVNVRLLTSKEEATPEKLKIWKNTGVKIKFIEQLPTKFSIIDDNDITLRIADKESYISLWIRNPSLNASLRAYFNLLWSQASDA